MGKQAIGIHALNYLHEFETSMHTLWYPQRTLVTTKGMDLFKLNEMPRGQCDIVAIASYGG